MPEITLLGPGRAAGIWAMFDYVEVEAKPPHPEVRLQGYGHYHETYEKDADGRWRISSLRLTRLRIDSLLGDGVAYHPSQRPSPDEDIS